jgi:uncharacterized protein (DUF849 family)
VHQPVILEIAINGVTSREVNACVPVTPGEVHAEALRCLDAGAAIVHSHADGMYPSAEEAAARYAEAYRPIVDARPDAILYPTVNLADEVGQRHGHQRLLARQGLIRQALLDPGSVNLGGSGADGLPEFAFPYVNGAEDIRLAVDICREHHLGASVSVFEPGFLRVILSAHRAGTLPAGTLVKFYFSSGGYFAGSDPIFSPPPIVEALDLYLAMIEGTGLPWGVACLGGSLLDTPIPRLALERGGHLRVGLEDHPGADSNLAEIERVRALCEQLGRPLASCAEAVEILGLPD